jgi:small-conductance mechanosensitive channel
VITYVLRKALDFLIKKNSTQLNADPTNFIFLKNSISYILYSIGLFWIFHKIPYFNALGNALFAGAGVLAAVIGFASQKAFSNIIGGLFILIFKPFRVSDFIEISNNRIGIVEEITLRHTIIRDFEARRIVIPNSQISDETIINSSITDEKIRRHIEVGISYDSNVDLAMKIMKEEIRSHPICMDNRTQEDKVSGVEIVPVVLLSLGDSSVNLRAYVWTKNVVEAFKLKCDVLKSIKSRFDNEDIEIPFPHRTLVIKNSDLSQLIDKNEKA